MQLVADLTYLISTINVFGENTMQEIVFELDSEYIELCKLLKNIGIAATGGEAKIIIDNGDVFVDEILELRKKRKVSAGSVVTIGNIKIYVHAAQ